MYGLQDYITAKKGETVDVLRHQCISHILVDALPGVFWTGQAVSIHV